MNAKKWVELLKKNNWVSEEDSQCRLAYIDTLDDMQAAADFLDLIGFAPHRSARGIFWGDSASNMSPAEKMRELIKIDAFISVKKNITIMAMTPEDIFEIDKPLCSRCNGTGKVMVEAPFGGDRSWSKPMACGCQFTMPHYAVDTQAENQ